MKNPIAKYLMCSYAYYKLDKNLITDQEFDQLAKHILDNWDAIDHPPVSYTHLTLPTK